MENEVFGMDKIHLNGKELERMGAVNGRDQSKDVEETKLAENYESVERRGRCKNWAKSCFLQED